MKLFSIFLIISFPGISQEPPPVIQQQMEEWGASTEAESIEDDSRLQLLEDFKRNPLNLNSATKEDLLNMHLLNEFQVAHLIRYRTVFGEFINLYELQAVPYFDLATIQRILPYIQIESSGNLKSAIADRLKSGEHQLLFRWAYTLEKAVGYNRQLPVHFLGDGNQVLFRYRYQGKHLQWGMLGEKDRGEQFFRGAQKTGFDFYSIHLFIRNFKKIRALALGDFVVNLGQGLVHWQSMGSGKGMQIFNSKREGPVLSPYRSAGEFNFLRGVGMSIGLKKLEFTLFGSFRKLSANTDDTAGIFSGFSAAGLYRTLNEVADKNKVGLVTGGMNVTRKDSKGSAGLSAVYYHMSKEFRKQGSPENLFIPGGKELYFMSFNYSRTYKNIHFFGEVAMDKRNAIAITNGMIMTLDAKADLAFHYRKLPIEYYSLFGNAFTESSLPANEEGMFAGLMVRAAKGLTLQGFADVFSFPWLRYRAAAPTKGFEYLCSLDFQPGRQASLVIIYRHKNKPVNKEGQNYDFPNRASRQSIRLQFNSHLNPALEFRTRAELVICKGPAVDTEQGFMIYMEPIYKRIKWQCGIRLQWFETESYNSRIYSYEADVLLSSSIFWAYDKGFRYYINGRYELNKQLFICGRISQSGYAGKTSVGSSYSAIPGNKKTEIKLQLLVNF